MKYYISIKIGRNFQYALQYQSNLNIPIDPMFNSPELFINVIRTSKEMKCS